MTNLKKQQKETKKNYRQGQLRSNNMNEKGSKQERRERDNRQKMIEEAEHPAKEMRKKRNTAQGHKIRGEKQRKVGNK